MLLIDSDISIFCDLAGMENAKRLLQEIVILPALRPEVYIIKYFAKDGFYSF